MKLEAGMMFKIPVSEKLFGIGDIVSVPEEHYFVFRVFQSLHGRLPTRIEDSVLLMGATMDAKIYVGDWKRIELIPISVISSISRNARKPLHPIQIIVRLLFGQANAGSTVLTIVSPVRFELALKAFHNLGPWKPEYDSILFK